MPARTAKHTSPTLNIKLTAEQHDRAVQSHSGACLIADAIKAQHPHLSNVSVDMATIRVTDRKRGLRFIYLTSPEAQLVLLSFDQGWSNPTEELTIRRAVKVQPITRAKNGQSSIKQIKATREEKRAALEAKESAGEPLTKGEKISLTRLRQPYEPVERPTTEGEPTVHQDGAKIPVVVGGRPMAQGAAHPNLLRSRDRHFGAKIAAPGAAWDRAVAEAIEQRDAQV